jgi:hypothetical protein
MGERLSVAPNGEPGALAVSEAHGAGCAVIGTFDGIAEQLEEDRAGVLTDPTPASQLVAALQS